jgi:nicotinamide riboside kinase
MASSDNKEEKIEEEANTQDILVDYHVMDLYTMMRDNTRIDNQEQESDPNKHRKEFKVKIKRQMENYKEHCAMMNMKAWLDVYGNKNYLNEEAKNPLELKERINKIKDPGYIAKVFDVLT